jgi:hypothetical protein
LNDLSRGGGGGGLLHCAAILCKYGFEVWWVLSAGCEEGLKEWEIGNGSRLWVPDCGMNRVWISGGIFTVAEHVWARIA